MIVALHIATGAAAGAASGSRLSALVLVAGPSPRGRSPAHQDIRARRFEIGSGLASVLLLIAWRPARSGDAWRRSEFRP